MSRVTMLAAPLLMCCSAAGAATAGDGPGSDAASIAMRLWPGTFDITEQIVHDDEPELTRPVGAEERIEVVVAPVEIPWLGRHVLYTEEYPNDARADLRRQVLLALHDGAHAGELRIAQYTFRNGSAWRALHLRPALWPQLGAADLETLPACDLFLEASGDTLQGGTRGRDCPGLARLSGSRSEYDLALAPGLYWYRKRIVDVDGELRREIAGYTYVEIEDARLFSCSIRLGEAGELRIDLHDQGGRVRFSAGSRGDLELTLYGRDWPFPQGRDVLQLLLSRAGGGAVLATGWAAAPGAAVELRYGDLQARCTPVVPERDELLSRAAGMSAHRARPGRLRPDSGPSSRLMCGVVQR